MLRQRIVKWGLAKNLKEAEARAALRLLRVAREAGSLNPAVEYRSRKIRFDNLREHFRKKLSAGSALDDLPTPLESSAPTPDGMKLCEPAVIHPTARGGQRVSTEIAEISEPTILDFERSNRTGQSDARRLEYSQGHLDLLRNQLHATFLNTDPNEATIIPDYTLTADVRLDPALILEQALHLHQCQQTHSDQEKWQSSFVLRTRLWHEYDHLVETVARQTSYSSHVAMACFAVLFGCWLLPFTRHAFLPSVSWAILCSRLDHTKEGDKPEVSPSIVDDSVLERLLCEQAHFLAAIPRQFGPPSKQPPIQTQALFSQIFKEASGNIELQELMVDNAPLYEKYPQLYQRRVLLAQRLASCIKDTQEAEVVRTDAIGSLKAQHVTDPFSAKPTKLGELHVYNGMLGDAYMYFMCSSAYALDQEDDVCASTLIFSDVRRRQLLEQDCSRFKLTDKLSDNSVYINAIPNLTSCKQIEISCPRHKWEPRLIDTKDWLWISIGLLGRGSTRMSEKTKRIFGL